MTARKSIVTSVVIKNFERGVYHLKSDGNRKWDKMASGMSIIVIEMKHSELRRRCSLIAIHVLIMNMKKCSPLRVHGTKGYIRAEIGKDVAQLILSSLQGLERRVEAYSWNFTRSSAQFFLLLPPRRQSRGGSVPIYSPICRFR
jgi:hypothetical protein